jgi:Fe-S oxidoreductase
MARMKIEVQAARAKKYGLSLHDRLVGYLPYYAPRAAKAAALLNARDRIPGGARIAEWITGFSARRSLPRWRPDWFRDEEANSGSGGEDSREVVLFVDTFNRYFERENIDASLTVLRAAGYHVHIATPFRQGSRPLCCGRTLLAVGRVDEARLEAERTIFALEPFLARGVPIVGLEPSCVLGFRDEIPALIKDVSARHLAQQSFLLEEFLAREAKEGKVSLKLAPIGKRALVHGHCHQKAFDAFTPTEDVLKLIPELTVEIVDSSCCGMAGSFGFDAETIDVSLAMGELSLLPAVRKAEADTIVVADGTSCRHQIRYGAEREALHVARVLALSVAAAKHA